MVKNVSVAMATCNGERFIAGQISSILQQLTLDDELIISDDASTDNTVKVVESFSDPRIVLYQVKFNSFVKNFEFALQQCRGNYIFLSDQDDIWLDNKVTTMLQHLRSSVLVVSNAMVADKAGAPLFPFYQLSSSQMNHKPVWWKIFRAPTPGCCMAFRRELLCKALPFPFNMYMHDRWIWALSCIYASPLIIDDIFLLYRRHEHNVTNINGKDPVLLRKSQVSTWEKLRIRYILARAIMIKMVNDFIGRDHLRFGGLYENTR